MKVFDELLLDADWSVNAGSWMWLSCSSFFTQFFPLYDPVRFGRKADPNGDYIRKYVPALKNFPIQVCQLFVYNGKKVSCLCTKFDMPHTISEVVASEASLLT